MTGSPQARALHRGSGSASRFGIEIVVVAVVLAALEAPPPAVETVAAGPFQGAAARHSRTLLV